MTELGSARALDQLLDVDAGLDEQLLERFGAAEHPVLEPDLRGLPPVAQLLDLALEARHLPAETDLDLARRVALLADLGEARLGGVQLLLELRLLRRHALHQVLDPGHRLLEVADQGAGVVALLRDARELAIARLRAAAPGSP